MAVEERETTTEEEAAPALSVSAAMGLAKNAGAGPLVIVLVGLVAGGLCGALNGILITRFALPSIVVTIGTMSLFRGLSYIVLGDQAYTGYPASFAWFGQGYVFWVITVELVIFALAAIIFGVKMPTCSTVWTAPFDIMRMRWPLRRCPSRTRTSTTTPR